MMLSTRIKNRKAQVVIELAIGLISLLILFVGIAKAWLWLSKCIVERQENYQSNRITYYDSGASNQSTTWNTYYTPSTFNIAN